MEAILKISVRYHSSQMSSRFHENHYSKKNGFVVIYFCCFGIS